MSPFFLAPKSLRPGLVALLWPVVLQAGNVLLIVADDLGADSFPLTAGAGASVPPMPNLVALKNRGVLFSRAYGHPVCSPSRAAMLTGRHPFRTGIGAQLVGAASPQLQAAEFTLPEAFAANPSTGHALAMFGKWHLNAGAATNDTPRTIGGWPHFAGSIAGALPDYSSWTKVTDGVAAATTAYATTDAIDDAIDWIAERGSTPWFAWVALNAPHAPLHQPPLDLHGYDAVAATNRNLYEAMCEAMDTEVGRLLAAVDLAATTVIFIGDNGTPQNVIQPPYTAAHSKGTLYEGGTRVPLIIAGKGVAGPNRSSAAPVHCVDLYSTILELAGINVAATQPPARTIDSRSVIPVLENRAEAPRHAFAEQFGSDLTTAQSGRAIIDAAGYKLIQFDDGHEEFYKTATDLNEATTLLGNVALSASDQAAYAALKLELAEARGIVTPDEPLLTSWFTRDSGQYARLFPTLADMNNGNAVSTWSRGTGVQASPTYSGVHQIDFSDQWVYIRSSGLPGHVMGPWYLNAQKTNLFPNYPSNTAARFRFPRVPVIPPTKTLFGGGTVGYFVDGVSVFDIRDAFFWNGTADVAGSGFWNRDAYVNERVTFDNAGAHQAGNNHHYHANPVALRHRLGDHVDYQQATNFYTESTAPVTKHSPILGWVRDGLPIYGPYGYAEAMNPHGGVRRMIGGFLPRNGQAGTDNLTATGRTTLPQWAVRAYNVAASQNGPPVSGDYPLGRYLEDNAFMGDLIKPSTGQPYQMASGAAANDFDLNEYNVRFCVTPEFPAGTWAYFLCIGADGLPAFPYQVGRSYYGDPVGGAVTRDSEPVTTSFIGGPATAEKAGGVSVDGNDVTVTWQAVEGGVYTVEASENLATWAPVASGVVASGDDLGSLTENNVAQPPTTRRFYRASRTGISTYDRAGFAGTVASAPPVTGGGPNTVTPNSGIRGSSVTVVIELDPALTPSLPPANVAVFSVTVAGGGVTTSAITRPGQTLVQVTFAIDPLAATGARNVSVRFNNATGPQRTINGAFTVN
jgi:arylsulfatase A-like enzyme